MTSPPIDASVVIVSFNTSAVLRECLETLYRESEGLVIETLVVDNDSKDDSVAMVRQHFPQVQVLTSEVNLGFAGANNLAFRQCQGRHVALLNSDAFVKPGAMQRAVALMDEHPHVGLAGGRLVGRDGGWQPSARMFPSLLNDFLTLTGLSAKYPQSSFFGRFDRTWAPDDEAAKVDWVPGAFSIVRRSVLDKVGPFDERFFLYYEEVDLCRRVIAAGHDVMYWPEIEVIHLGGESSKTVKRLTFSSSGSQLALWRMRSALMYYRKHHGWLGAMGARLLEQGWHGLRLLKEKLRKEPLAQKIEESKVIIGLMSQAWKDTHGGAVCPPRPW